MQKVHEHVFEVEFVSSPQLVQSIRPRWDVGPGLHNADALPHELHGLHYLDVLPHDQLSTFLDEWDDGMLPVVSLPESRTQLVGRHQAFTPVGCRVSLKVGFGDTPI